MASPVISVALHNTVDDCMNLIDCQPHPPPPRGRPGSGGRYRFDRRSGEVDHFRTGRHHSSARKLHHRKVSGVVASDSVERYACHIAKRDAGFAEGAEFVAPPVTNLERRTGSRLVLRLTGLTGKCTRPDRMSSRESGIQPASVALHCAPVATTVCNHDFSAANSLFRLSLASPKSIMHFGL